MSAQPGPVFLERRGYRQRRLIDALRLLPLLGVILLAIPLLWPEGAEEGLPVSRAIIYIFGTWSGLTLVSALIVRRVTDQAVDGFDAGRPAAGLVTISPEPAIVIETTLQDDDPDDQELP